MSGYLQRLATSTVRSEQRVKPLIGGLFARQPEQAIEEGAATIVPRAASSSGSQLSGAITHEISAQISSDELKEDETPVRNALVERSAVLLPDESRSRPRLVAVDQDYVVASQRKQITEHEAPARSIERPAEPDLLVALTQVIERPAESRPGIAGDADVREALVPISLRPVVAGPAQISARPRAVQPQTATVRAGGDDIQIHIGRIEVIAVPQQPAPRPAAAPARRGPSLEEYLQRRDRRSR